jgi:hypothetical protein
VDLFSIVGACLRRWYVTLPLVALTALFAYQAYESVEPEYTASRWIVILPSLEQDNLAPAPTQADAEVEPPSNPYSGQGGSRFAVAVLTRNLNSTAFHARIEPRLAGRGTFEADAANEQPLIEIVAVAPREEDVYSILDAVVEEAAVVLHEVQMSANAPTETHYRIAPAVPAGPAEDATPSRFRVAGAIAVVGSGLSMILAVASDGLLTRWSEGPRRPRGERQRGEVRPRERSEGRRSWRSRERDDAADGASMIGGPEEAHSTALAGDPEPVHERTEASPPRVP